MGELQSFQNGCDSRGERAVTKSGMGTWDWDVGLGLGDVERYTRDSGLGTRGRKTQGRGTRGLGNVITKQHLNL